MNFWQGLPRPFFVLAPMEDVTDTVFRQIVARVGRPHVFITEFTHVDAILHDASMGRLKYSEVERPIVAQIWGTNPESYYKAAQVIKGLRFDGIDINLGCPVRDIVKQGGCSALIGNNLLVSEIIAAIKAGGGGLPVSVKTRIGRKKIETEDWISYLLTQNLAAISIHGRTAAEKSLVPAHWDEIAKATILPNPFKTLIIGNGDVKNLLEAKRYALDYGVDGVMIGRGIFDNVSLFSGSELSRADKLNLLVEHMRLYQSTWGQAKNFQIMKKFIKTYVNGFAGASEARHNLMQAANSNELLALLS